MRGVWQNSWTCSDVQKKEKLLWRRVCLSMHHLFQTEDRRHSDNYYPLQIEQRLEACFWENYCSYIFCNFSLKINASREHFHFSKKIIKELTLTQQAGISVLNKWIWNPPKGCTSNMFCISQMVLVGKQRKSKLRAAFLDKTLTGSFKV